jgi:hypothetical protein
MPVAASLPETLATPPPAGLSPAQQNVVPFWRCGVLLALAVLTLIIGALNPAPTGTLQSGVILALPDIVKVQLPDNHDLQFYGSKAPISDGELGILPPDTELLRKQYDDIRNHESVLCTILLSGVEQNSIHRAEVCLPGQGWTVVGQGNLPIALDSGHTLVVRNLTIQRSMITANNEHRMLQAHFMYWFVGENMTTPSQLMRVVFNTWDHILYNRAYRWAYIMVMSPVTSSIRPDGLDAAQTEAMMTGFIRHAVPTFQKNEMVDPTSR